MSLKGIRSYRYEAERLETKLGRVFLYWCFGLGMVILLGIQSVTAAIVPSATDYGSHGLAALVGSIAFAILVTYVGATTFKVSHCERKVIESREAGVRIVVLMFFSALCLLRGGWWLIDLWQQDADSIFNYVGTVWFLGAGVIGIPLALLLITERRDVRQSG